MSVLIEGMEMPTRCAECRLSTVHSFNDRPLCDVLVEYMSYGEWEAKRLDHCPLVPVQPHGRLIDADALHKLFEYQWHYLQMLDWNENPTAEATQSGINWCINTMHDDAPAVIPASEEG